MSHCDLASGVPISDTARRNDWRPASIAQGCYAGVNASRIATGTRIILRLVVHVNASGMSNVTGPSAVELE